MKFHFIAAKKNQQAHEAFKTYTALYGQTPLRSNEAMTIVALGGDGTLLEAAQEAFMRNLPVYGVNLGNLGFLLNKPPENPDDLEEQVATAILTRLHPWSVVSFDAHNKVRKAFAFNDVSVTHAHPARAIDLFLTMPTLYENRKVSGNGLIIGTEVSALGYFAAAGGMPPKTLMPDQTLIAPLAAMPLSDGYLKAFVCECPHANVIVPPSSYRKAMVVADRTQLTENGRVVVIERVMDRSLQLLHRSDYPLPVKYRDYHKLVRQKQTAPNF